jgi:predicted DNA-binding ribbon-helix-helix protein
MDPDEPLTLRSPKKDGEIKANSHENFYNSLQSMANEDPIIVASFIRKYAESIQNSDIETAIKLMKTVRSIRG